MELVASRTRACGLRNLPCRGRKINRALPVHTFLPFEILIISCDYKYNERRGDMDICRQTIRKSSGLSKNLDRHFRSLLLEMYTLWKLVSQQWNLSK